MVVTAVLDAMVMSDMIVIGILPGAVVFFGCTAVLGQGRDAVA
jgi:hypoxanthine-guanine phosphoribosyltransferase